MYSFRLRDVALVVTAVRELAPRLSLPFPATAIRFHGQRQHEMLFEYETSGPSCRTCSALDPDTSFQEVSVASLRDSSEQGCPRCKVLTKVVDSIACEAD